MNNPQPLVRMKNICKSFGRVQVLKNVDLEVFPGEIHILAGENGAGKSTLIKILAGVHTDFQGTIEIDGNVVQPDSPLEANALGVVTIYQELSLVPSMSVADNIFLGRSITIMGLSKTIFNMLKQNEFCNNWDWIFLLNNWWRPSLLRCNN